MADYYLSEAQQAYLQEMKNYKTHGVRILIDGIEKPESEWKNMFMLADNRTDGSVWAYMPDYLEEFNGKIYEIRYIKVYNALSV